MKFTARQIADIIGGRIEGDVNAEVSSFGKIEEAVKGQISFLANPKYEDFLYSTQASIVIINENQELKTPVKSTLIRVKDAYTSFAVLLTAYQKMLTQNLKGIQTPSFISSTAKTGKDVFIGAFAYLGESVEVGDNTKIFPQVYLGDKVRIGKNTIINAGVKIYENCIVGDNVIIHAGTVIGSDGFGFVPQADGTYNKIPQIGNVVIEDNVEIGANTTIDRATIGSTIIRAGAKLDNLIQVAHNVEIGNSSAIAAQVGISGSVKIGTGVMIGGQAGLAGHIKIGDNAKINAQSGVGKSIPDGKAVTGSPAYEYTAAMRSLAIVKNLPEIEKRLEEIEKLLKKLTSS
jgi:UDP-3-O-[3-hydroxymyristoyl] glucosamine N-acyltransferase